MRYERKYQVEHLSTPQLHQLVRRHPGSFRPSYPDRWVNNIYFDTPDFSAFKENVAGVARRVKYRVRWYGKDPFDISDPKLEIKAKFNQLGSKKVIPVDDFELNDWKGIARQVNHHSQSYLIPVLLNAYLRSYYTTSDGIFRITIDRQLRYSAILLTRHFFTYPVQKDSAVVELKYPEKADADAARILQYIPLRQTKNSKYVVGINLTMGG